jgi:YidC/Oxa1 family membrane protein insertase
VENKTGKAVTLYPYSLISRHYRPEVSGFFILHEGLIGVMGEDGLKEISYSDIAEKKKETFKATSGWLGITDKYWATALIPNQRAPYEAYFQQFPASGPNTRETFQTLFLLSPVTIQPGTKQAETSMLFAGAKQVGVIDGYEAKYGIKMFDKMIDWGWFPFITKPLFQALDFFFRLFGNFGVSILIVTVLVKLVFFPLANKSYASMSKMKKLQPEMKRIQERYADDRMKQQQAMMELYKKEKVNPMAGCLPILIQIPVFFALYKVIFVSIEMRHAPFFGWIQDLAAPDPTTLFNLFGLLPWSPPTFLMIGIWPILMGITMWVQMKLNPSAPDPVQQQIFTWMPVFFTYLLAAFPAGLVIYWTWNNLLSILQQWVIMRRQGVEVNLLENMGLSKLMDKMASKGRPAE